jgi:hypothetical protein
MFQVFTSSVAEFNSEFAALNGKVYILYVFLFYSCGWVPETKNQATIVTCVSS